MILSEGILIESTGNETLFPAAMPFIQAFFGAKTHRQTKEQVFSGRQTEFSGN